MDYLGGFMKIGFDHKKYLEEQSKFILERVNNYDNTIITQRHS